MTIAVLVPYWIGLYYFAHIPIPGWVYQAQVSDKSLHFLAYLVLVFLLWFSVSPDRRVNWRRGAAWWVLLVVNCYGAADEVVQGYVGRQCDLADFFANAAGSITGMLVFTLLMFWPSLLVVTAIAVFLLTNLARTNISELQPVASVFFYFLSYALLTGLWIRQIRLVLLKPALVNWLLVTAVPPGVFLVAAKLFSVVLGKAFSGRNVMISALGIAVVVIGAFLVGSVGRDQRYRRISRRS